MPEILSPEEAACVLKPGMSVFVQGGAAEPVVLLKAISNSETAADGVHFTAVFIPGVNMNDPASFHTRASATGFFATPCNRATVADGRTRLMPISYSAIAKYLTDDLTIDLAFIQVGPPDKNNNCPLGPSVDFVPMIMDKARTIIAEVNDSMPCVPGGLSIAYDKLDYVVPADHALITCAQPEQTDTLSAIGANVARLIDDGDSIQVGIGKVPTAVLRALKGKRDLGIFSGLISDPMMGLIESGVITGARKSVDPGKITTGIALGSEEFYDYIADREDILYRPVSDTHDVSFLGQQENLVAVNSAIQVDLYGQVAAESLNGFQVSGTGGLLDFIRGAHRSKNGRAIIALPSMSNGDKKSRIVPTLPDNEIVTVGRGDVDLVVTEHGVANLRHKSIDERARALIEIADPGSRARLASAWSSLRDKHLGA